MREYKAAGLQVGDMAQAGQKFSARLVMVGTCHMVVYGTRYHSDLT